MTTLHLGFPARMPGSVARALRRLPTVNTTGIPVVKDFGIFIDTHRDQPHVGSFSADIHRGTCVPTMVDYDIADDALIHPETGVLLARHDKHMFITPDAWSDFLVKALIETGVDPRGGDGSLPTSHFRDARKGIYLLRSFRQMVQWDERHLNHPL